ncbi:MAG: hypothetical protein WC374_12820 [Phycisphaerae bacterium]
MNPYADKTYRKEQNITDAMREATAKRQRRAEKFRLRAEQRRRENVTARAVGNIRRQQLRQRGIGIYLFFWAAGIFLGMLIHWALELL